VETSDPLGRRPTILDVVGFTAHAPSNHGAAMMDGRRFERFARLLAMGPSRGSLAPAALAGSAPNEAAAAGDLACGAGKSRCGGTCVDLQLNLRNCGACGVACDRDELCRRGVCVRREAIRGLGRIDRGRDVDSRYGGARWASD
jgi:stigma-specific protein Stig1